MYVLQFTHTLKIDSNNDSDHNSTSNKKKILYIYDMQIYPHNDNNEIISL